MVTSMVVLWRQYLYHQKSKYQRGYGPLLDGFRKVDFGDVDKLKEAINENTNAILVEPIQGEAGINIPPEGYLKAIRELCDEHNILFIADEIQAGLGRSGKLFATDWDNVKPDVYILGKALGGGVLPISVVLVITKYWMYLHLVHTVLRLVVIH